MKRLFAMLVTAVICLTAVSGCKREKTADELYKNISLKEWYDYAAFEYDFPLLITATDEEISAKYPGFNNLTIRQQIVALPSISIQSTEIAFVELESEYDAEELIKIFEARKTVLMDEWAEMPEQRQLVEDAVIVHYGRYVLFMVAFDAREIEEDFKIEVLLEAPEETD